MLKYALAAFIALSGSPAFAANWWYVGYTGSGKNETAHFIDMASVSSNTTKKKYWSFIINEVLNKSGIRKEKQLHEADCEQRTAKLLSYVEYGNNNTIMTARTLPYYSGQATPLVPDSIGESKWNLICLGAEEGAMALEENMTPEEAAVSIFRD